MAQVKSERPCCHEMITLRAPAVAGHQLSRTMRCLCGDSRKWLVTVTCVKEATATAQAEQKVEWHA